MASNINENNGRYSLYSLKSIPWHGLGTIVQEQPKYMSEVINLSGLNFTVAKRQSVIDISDDLLPKYRSVPGAYATYRTDNGVIFGAVGTDYTIVQNVVAFDFLDKVLGEGLFKIETAGALGNGEVIFVTAKVPGHIKLGKTGNDIVDKYIVFTTSHDGSTPVRAMLTPIRVVCANTLNMALNNNSNSFTVKHTKNAQKKIDKGLELMGLSNIYFNDMEETLNAMTKVLIRDESVRGHCCKIILNDVEFKAYEKNDYDFNTLGGISTYKKNRVHEMETSVFQGPGQDLHMNTGLWLFNGITSYYGNTVTYANQEDKFRTLSDGSAQKEVQKLFNKIVAQL